MSYLFVPYAQDEGNDNLVGMAKLWIKRVGLDVRGKTPPVLAVYDGASKPLAKAGTNEAVYVLAHGTAQKEFAGEYVANNHGNTDVTNFMSAEEVSNRVAGAGLPVGHRNLRLYICNLNGSLRPFAEKVYKILAPTYGSLQVSYYLSSVSLPIAAGDGSYHKVGMAVAMPDPNNGFILLSATGGRASSLRVTVDPKSTLS
jgi:hypothetical protein